MDVSRTYLTPGRVLSGLPVDRPRRSRPAHAGSGQTRETGTPASATRQSQKVVVGFGEDSVKLPQVAAMAIKRNVSQAKELVPSLEESSARVRERLEEDARELREAERPRPQRLDLNAPRETAVNAARSLVAGVNDAAGKTLARAWNEEDAPGNRLDIRIGNTRVAFDAPPLRPPLDLLA